MSLSPSQPPSVRFGPFEASLASRELRKHGVRIRLPGQPFDILAILLERAGQTLPAKNSVGVCGEPIRSWTSITA